MVPHPVFCQTPEVTNTVLNHFGSSINAIGSKPSNPIKWLIIPVVGVRKAINIPAKTTTEITCGAYVIVWTDFLYNPSLASLSANANMTGRGNPTNNSYTLIPSVFVIKSQK